MKPGFNSLVTSRGFRVYNSPPAQPFRFSNVASTALKHITVRTTSSYTASYFITALKHIHSGVDLTWYSKITDSNILSNLAMFGDYGKCFCDKYAWSCRTRCSKDAGVLGYCRDCVS